MTNETRTPRKPRSTNKGGGEADNTVNNAGSRGPRSPRKPRTQNTAPAGAAPRGPRTKTPSAVSAPSATTADANDFNPLLDEEDDDELANGDSDDTANDFVTSVSTASNAADFNPLLDEDDDEDEAVSESADVLDGESESDGSDFFNPLLDEDDEEVLAGDDVKRVRDSDALTGASNKGLVSVDVQPQQSGEELKAAIRDNDLDPYAHTRKKRPGGNKPGPKPNPNSKNQQKKRLTEANRAIVREHDAKKKAAREAMSTPEQKQEAWDKLSPEVQEQANKVRQHALDGTTSPIASRKKKTDKKYRRRDLTDKDYQILTSIALGGLLTVNSAFNGLFPPGTERGNATSTVRKRLLGLAELGVISRCTVPGANFYLLTNKGAAALEAGVDFPAEQAWVLSPEKVMGQKAKHWIAYSSYVSRLVGQHGVGLAERGDSSFFVSEYSLLRDLNREYSDPSAKSRTLSRKVIAGGLNKDFNEFVSIEKKDGKAAAREYLKANPRLFVLFHFDPLNPEHSRTKLPDGVYYDASTDEFVAVEIETTAKSKNDYESLFSMYQQSIGKVFDRVHYICSENQIVNIIQRSKAAQQLRGRGQTKRLTIEKLHSWTKAETNNTMDIWAL